MRVRVYLSLLACLLLLAACTSQPSKETTSPEKTTNATESSTASAPSYPPPAVQQETPAGPYPYPTAGIVSAEAYPPPTTAEAPAVGTPFRLNKPIVEGATKISGTGPAGVPFLVLDVTLMGATIGQDTIKEDGTFSIQVNPLEKGHRIGITTGDLEGTQWKDEDFYGHGYDGDEPMLQPLVTYYFDTTVVTEK